MASSSDPDPWPEYDFTRYHDLPVAETQPPTLEEMAAERAARDREAWERARTEPSPTLRLIEEAPDPRDDPDFDPRQVSVDSILDVERGDITPRSGPNHGDAVVQPPGTEGHVPRPLGPADGVYGLGSSADRAIRTWTACELEMALANARSDWIARPGILAIGSVTELDGKVKIAGKTTLALHMVRAVLDGGPFLGEATRMARVVYVTEQSKHTFVDALRLAGLEGRGDELRIILREDIGNVAWPDLVRACRMDGYEVVILDTIGKLARVKDENAAAEWAAAMSPVQDLAAGGRAVMILRHDRKQGGEVGESGRGSSQLSGDVDIILGLRRPEGNQGPNRRALVGLSRFRETRDMLVIELTSEGYVVKGDREAVAASDARDFILRTMVSEFEEKELHRAGLAVGHSRPTLGRALRGLVDEDKVHRSGAGRRGDPYRYQVAPQTHSLGFERDEEKALIGGGADIAGVVESLFGADTEFRGRWTT